MRLQVQPPGQGPREVDVLAEVSQAHRIRDLTSEYGVMDMLARHRTKDAADVTFTTTMKPYSFGKSRPSTSRITKSTT